MKTTSIAVGLCLVASFLPSTAFAAEDGLTMKPGRWRVTSKTEAPLFGTPNKTVAISCISKDNNDPLDKMVEDPCKVTERSATADTLKWKWSCKAEKLPDPILGSGELKVEGEKLSGKSSVVYTVKEKKLTVDWTLTGKYLGECKKAE
jgi:hypothetical protein